VKHIWKNDALLTIIIIGLAVVAYYVFSPRIENSSGCLFKSGDVVRFKGLDKKFIVYRTDWSCEVVVINDLLDVHAYDEKYFEKVN
jgi:hypothetical protein